VDGFRAATTFLTRLRVGAGNEDDIVRGVPWFPVVGALLGLTGGAVYAGARYVLPSFPAAAIAVGSIAWITGAFHEDGLADTADAFGGVRSREETLRIMKDPSIGTYGTVALVLSFALRIGALAALPSTTALAVLPAAHAMSRGGAIGLLASPVATDVGLGASYASLASGRQIRTAMTVGLIVCALAMGPLFGAAAVGVAVMSLVLGRIARRRIGGITGDVLGAAQQAGEIVVLLVGAAGVHRGWLHVPWFS
jgi:adenosylcobinamide-GDP ribazoletransferase